MVTHLVGTSINQGALRFSDFGRIAVTNVQCFFAHVYIIWGVLY